jgi:hypothetical protein
MQAIALAAKIKAIRIQRFENGVGSVTMLLRLYEMPIAKQREAINRLVADGYIGSAEEIFEMMKGKRLDRYVTPSDSPTLSKGMSDNVLDKGAHYLHINIDLL